MDLTQCVAAPVGVWETFTSTLQVNGTFHVFAFSNGVFAVVNNPPDTDDFGPSMLMIVDASYAWASMVVYQYPDAVRFQRDLNDEQQLPVGRDVAGTQYLFAADPVTERQVSGSAGQRPRAGRALGAGRRLNRIMAPAAAYWTSSRLSSRSAATSL